ncbi:uncharacterized protein LOC142176201 [Nicotiana tabacum]|uniref:Uncharacterized protein LOC142176201 n=1 Tax=Nicotiana tabacum TaxID=4097 RepID=A0AC58TQD2_TOBAC
MSYWKKGFGIEASQVIGTPISIATRPDIDEPGSPLNQTTHRDITESLMYITASRPDIVLRVGFCARFQSNPKDSHLKAGVRILTYLRKHRTWFSTILQLKQNMYHQPPTVLKCCGPTENWKNLSPTQEGPNTMISKDQVADIFTKSLGKKAF